MWEYLRDGGWGMVPVLVFGGVAMVVASRHAFAPARRFVPLIVGFCAVTMIAGVLGTVTGVQHSVAYVDQASSTDRWLVAIGLREALNTLVAACVSVVLAALVGTCGSYRHALRDERREAGATAR